MVLSSFVVSMKKNNDAYSGKFESAILMFNSGKSIAQISHELGIPYPTVYSWIKRGRKKTQSERFFEFVRNNGPLTLLDAKSEFPKHSDVLLKAVSRGYRIKKHDSGLKHPFRFWYYVEGQEQALSEKINSLRNAITSAKNEIRKRI